MSTRSLIGYRKNNNVVYTYCHFDGYPAGVGKILYNYYNTPELAEQIASLHGIRSLEETIEQTKKHLFEDHYGEMPIKDYRKTDICWVDYVYLYEKPLGWSIRPCFGYGLEEMAENDLWELY